MNLSRETLKGGLACPKCCWNATKRSHFCFGLLLVMKNGSITTTPSAKNDMWNVLYSELLKPGETINGERYRKQFRLRTIWKTVDGKFYPTRLIAQTLLLLTTICSGRCRTPSLEYGSHQNKVSKIGLIHSWPSSWRSSFGMETTNWQKDGKKS